MTVQTTPAAGRGRQQLLLIVGLFALPMLIAGVLAAIGYMPEGRRSYGQVLTPSAPVSESAQTLDGAEFRFATPEWYWTLVVRVPAQCDAGCVERLNLVPNIREIGLLTPRMRPYYDQAGMGQYYHGLAAPELTGDQMIVDLDGNRLAA